MPQFLSSLTNFEAYLFWAVPSLVGFTLNAVALANILLTPALRSKYYQQWSGLLAACNILSAGSWLIGPKYSKNLIPQVLCAVQEYVFMIASLWQAVISLFICFVAMASVVWRVSPSSRRMLVILVSSMMVCVFLVMGCVSHQTAGLFCSNDIDDLYSNGKWSQSFVVYVSLFIFPVMVSVVLQCVLCLVTYRRIKLGFVTNTTDQAESNYNRQMLLFSKRLLAYPIIFIFSWSMNITSITHSVITRNFNVRLGFIAGLLMASCSVLVGLNYFYFQQTYAPFLAPLMRCLKSEQVTTCQATSRNNKESTAEMSSTTGASISLQNSDSYPGSSARERSSTEESVATANTLNPLRQVSAATSSIINPDEFYVKFSEFDEETERYSLS